MKTKVPMDLFIELAADRAATLMLLHLDNRMLHNLWILFQKIEVTLEKLLNQ